MTIAELIEELKKFPLNAKVLVTSDGHMDISEFDYRQHDDTLLIRAEHSENY